LASMAAAFIAVKIFDYLFAGVSNSLTSGARAGVFVVAWTAVTARAGMNGFTKKVRQLRQSNADARDRLDAITKGDGP
jgi:hypothetical protein